MPRSKKTIGLALPKTLRSNKLVDIQNFLQLWKDSFDDMYKLLISDIITVELTGGAGGAVIYFGDKNTDGTWRIVVSGTDLNIEKRESGTYVAKSATIP